MTNDTQALLERLRDLGIRSADQAVIAIEALSSALADAERERDAMAEALRDALPALSALALEEKRRNARLPKDLHKMTAQVRHDKASRVALPAKQEPSQ